MKGYRDMKKVQPQNEKPFIHLFSTRIGNYLFDVNKNQIVEIPENVYHYLLSGCSETAEKDIENYISALKAEGFLKDKYPQITEHPVTEYYKFLVENNLEQLTLQVTQKCNLNCEYCVYSGNYANRHHADRWMTFETAKLAINYLVSHSSDTDEISLGFYGGEPLLAFELIKKCVTYAEKILEGRKIIFNFTTNGTLLTEEKFDFLVQHNFAILVSLDGPEHVQNRHRKYANSEIGSFKTIMSNLQKFKRKHPVYFHERIAFNSVIDPSYPYEEICKFTLTDETIKDSSFMSSVISDTYAYTKNKYDSTFVEEYEYERFKAFLWLIGRLDKNQIAPIVRESVSDIKRIAVMFERFKQEQLPVKGHRGGPCIPGVKKLFVSVDGKLYPCERVSESSEMTCIGDIRDGINIEKALEILNIENVTAEKCKKCWAYFHCFLCAAQADEGKCLSSRTICEKCGNCQYSIEETMKNYVTLKSFGYDYELI